MARAHGATVLVFALLVGRGAAQGETPAPPEMDERDVRRWTPRPLDGSGFNPEWRRASEESWRDTRVRAMDFGPFLGTSLRLREREAAGVGPGAGEPAGRASTHEVERGLAVFVGDPPEGTVVYEHNLVQCRAGWIGGTLGFAGSRYGFLDVPENAAPLLFLAPRTPGWSRRGTFDEDLPPRGFPLPREWAAHVGIHVHGRRTLLESRVDGCRVLEHPWVERAGGHVALARTIEVAESGRPMSIRVRPVRTPRSPEGRPVLVDDEGAVALVGGDRHAVLRCEGGWAVVALAPHDAPLVFKVLLTGPGTEPVSSLIAASPAPAPLDPLTRGGPELHPERILTRIEPAGRSGPYAVDRIVPPFENPWKALCFLSGIDFLPTGEAVVCAGHGDVWLVSGIGLGRPAWKRFATGLYQPMGLRVVDGVIHVIERGQITRIHDRDGNGEADFLECLSNRWTSLGWAHAFDLGLEHDPRGYWLFVKNGEWNTPHGGSVLRVRADGAGDAEVFATGFRHTNGIGISPDGRVSAAGQQGEWTPSSRIDLLRPGGFYGLMPSHHRREPPLLPDRPLLHLPLGTDNSSADQIWAPGTWGPLGGRMLHLSWGLCTLLEVLPQEVGGRLQAFAHTVPLPSFQAGPARARWSPHDGHLYVAGLKGWQTRGPWDGTLERVRHEGGGGPWPVPERVAAGPGTIEIAWRAPLDRGAMGDRSRYQVEAWNYLWSADYGSADWSLQEWGRKGRDRWDVVAAAVAEDCRTVRLAVPDLEPAMQVRVVARVRTAEGVEFDDEVVGTIHSVPLRPDAELERAVAAAEALGGSEPAWLDAGRRFHDFELRGEILVSDTGGSTATLHLRSRAAPGGGRTTEYALFLAGPDLGDLEDRGRRDGKLADWPSPLAAALVSPGRWTALRVRCEGARLRAWLDGVQICDFVETDTRVPETGRLGLSGSGFQIRGVTVRDLP